MLNTNLVISGFNLANVVAMSLTSSLSVNVINSGFINVNLISSTGLTLLEYQLDSSGYVAGGSVQNLQIKLPTGSQTYRDFSRHTVTLRATDSLGYTATSQPLPFTKGQNRDVDGDGYADFAAGAYGYSGNTGRAYLFLSSAVNGVASMTNAAASTTITGSGAGYLGVNVALCDINGDGYADWTIGAQNTTNGTAYIFYSQGTSGITSGISTSANRIITGAASADQFGYYLACADTNGDGYADLLAGAPGAASAAGKAYVFHSAGASGITITTALSASTTISGTPVNGYLGTVAGGDVNGDGFDDMVVAGWGSGTGGSVFIFHSAGATGIATASDSAAVATITATAAGVQFGKSVSVGDLNGDGYLDLAIGAPVVSASNGAAYIYRSQGAAGIASAVDTSAFNILSGSIGGQFGASVALGDVNGDGYADLGVGANAALTNQGQAYVFLSSGSGGYGNIADTAANAIISGTQASGGFGYAIGFGDYNADGFSDFLSGAYGVSANMGACYVFKSLGAGGIASATDTTASTRITGANAGEQFGLSVR